MMAQTEHFKTQARWGAWKAITTADGADVSLALVGPSTAPVHMLLSHNT